MMRAAFRARYNSRDGSRVPHRDFLTLHHDLGWDVDHNGTRTAGTHLPERFFTTSGTSLGLSTCRRHLVTGLITPAWSKTSCMAPKVLADLAPGDLAGNEEHRRGAGVCSGQAGGGIVNTRPRDHQGYPGFP